MSRRADAVLLLVVGALGAFVAVQIATRKPAAPVARAIVVEAPPAGKTAAPTTTNARAVSPTNTATLAATAPPVRDVELIKSRIAGTPGTYMPAMLEDLGHVLVRWPDRSQDGLRVWVQASTPVRDWNLQYAQMARDAFADWGSAGDQSGVPIRLDFVLDSASSDIQIVWIEKFAPEMGRRVGVTGRRTTAEGWITAAQITVAIHDSLGRTIRPNDLTGIVRHEAGHALGLGHSNDPRTKMYPTEMVNEITPADRATLRLLYSLPAGALR